MFAFIGRLSLAWALTLAACASPVYQDDRAERSALWNEVASTSVLVRNLDGGSGSGVVYFQSAHRALVITAAHVVGIERAVFIERGDLKYVGTVLRVDTTTDLAVVETLPVWPRVARVVTRGELREFGWGSRVTIVGHPLGAAQPHITDGRITAVNDGGYLRYSAPSFFGNSGGGVFVCVGGTWSLCSIAQRISGAAGVGPYPLMGKGAHPSNLLKFMDEVKD